MEKKALKVLSILEENGYEAYIVGGYVRDKLLGIESCLVFGRLNNDKEDGRHCWNIVNIEGHYYHLDVCFGDLILERSRNNCNTTLWRL